MNQQCVNDIIRILETASDRVFLRSERERIAEEDYDAHHETTALIISKIDKIIAECTPSISTQPTVPPGMSTVVRPPVTAQPPPGMPPITRQLTMGQVYQSLYPQWQQTAQQLQAAADSFQRPLCSICNNYFTKGALKTDQCWLCGISV
jgi:hypothetical protein